MVLGTPPSSNASASHGSICNTPLLIAVVFSALAKRNSHSSLMLSMLSFRSTPKYLISAMILS